MKSIGSSRKPVQVEDANVPTEADLLLHEDDDEESKRGDDATSEVYDEGSEVDSFSSTAKERSHRGRPAFRHFDLPSRQPLKRAMSDSKQSDEANASQQRAMQQRLDKFIRKQPQATRSPAAFTLLATPSP
jgi:hypothetical protein